MVSMPCNRGSVLLPDLRCEHPPRSSSCPIVRDPLPHDLSGATADLPSSTGPAPRHSTSATSGHPASLGNLQPEQGQIHASSESQRLFPGTTAPSPRTCPAAGISTDPSTSAPRATGYRSRSQGTRSSSSFQRTTTGTLSSQSRPTPPHHPFIAASISLATPPLHYSLMFPYPPFILFWTWHPPGTSSFPPASHASAASSTTTLPWSTATPPNLYLGSSSYVSLISFSLIPSPSHPRQS